MDFELLILAGMVIAAGSALQSASGFGFGMFAIPLLILLGTTAPSAIAIISICGAVQTVIGVYALRRHVNWPQVLVMIVIAGATLPAGVWVLHHVTLLETSTVRQFFGAIVLTALIAQWLLRIKPRDHLHWGWGGLATVLCGFMSGVSGMGGPPVVIWVMSHTWSNQRSRATLWTMFTGLTPFQQFFLYQRFGEEIIDAAGTGLLLAPMVLVGMVPGMWLGHRIPKPRLRQMSYVILLLIALYAILDPMVNGWLLDAVRR